MANPKVQFDLVANDKTDQGVKSAESRFAKLPKAANDSARSVNRLNEAVGKTAGKGNVVHLRNFTKTLTEVQKEASKAFGKDGFGKISELMKSVRGVRSALGDGLGRASALLAEAGEAGEAGEAAAGGLGAAAGAATGLSTALAGTGVAAAGVIGVLAAVTIAGFKISDSFAKSAGSVARLSEMLGIAAGDMQKFQLAGERYGIDKQTSATGLANFAQTVHDARYGRNQNAVALMARLGMTYKYNKAGQLDYNQMMLDLSDRLQKLAQRDPQAALNLANQFGVAGLLPMLRKGSGTVRKEMADTGKYGPVISDKALKMGEQQERQGVIREQIKDKGVLAAKEGVARVVAPLADRLTGVERSMVDSTESFSATVKKDFAGAVSAFKGAVDRITGRAAAPVPRAAPPRPSNGSFADAIRVYGEHSRNDQVSPKGARGEMQVMPGTAHNPGMGIRPAQDESIEEYNRVGREYADALLRRYNGDWALAAAAYNAGPGAVDRWIKAFGDPRKGEISDSDWIAHIPGRDGRRGYAETRHYAERVTHVHEFHGMPAGASVKSHTKGHSGATISHAMETWA